MRAQLDEGKNRQEDAVQRAVNDAASEIRTLRENVAMLRSKLEEEEILREDAVQSAVASAPKTAKIM